MSRWTYLIKRMVLAVPVLFFGMSLTFSIVYLGPIDPAAVMAGSAQQQNTQEAYRNAVRRLGLDEPLHEQYVDFMTDLLLFDFGQTWNVHAGRDAWALILEQAPRTIWMGFWAVLIAILVGIPLGFYAGLRSNTVADYVSSLLGIVWRAMPNFWLAIIVLAFLSRSEQFLFGLSWENLGPNIALTGTPDLSNVASLDGYVRATKKILPASVVLGSASMGNEMRIGRNAVLETRNEKFVDTARAKGVSGRAIVWKHIFRNALIPLVPLITGEAFLLVGGSVLVEQVFGINGLGQLFIRAALNADLPLMTSLMYVFILLLLVINILQDVLYTVIDPRIGLEGGE